MKLTIEQLAERLEAELSVDAKDRRKSISGVCSLEAAGDGDVTFLASDKHRASVDKSAACAFIVAERIDGLTKPQLIVKNVNAALIEALNIFAPKLPPLIEGIDPTAKIAPTANIDKSASVGAHAVIANGVEIGEHSVINSGCCIGHNTKIGNNCRLDSNVVVYHNCQLGNNVIIQANTTIGSVGFGYSFIDGSHRLIPHNGGVIIEDFVEIGANCCIDRAKFGNTVIGAGTKIDNLVQIAHNVIIGKCCLIAALTGISGSCKLGDGVVLAGQVGLADNIEIGDGTMVGAQSGVMSSVPAGQKLAWTPAIEKSKAIRIVGTALKLPEIASQLKQIARRLDKLEVAEDDKN
jgi:UDP-3-O-[3-hydroxymyristoyl] glucosamine N-acyltransferase